MSKKSNFTSLQLVKNKQWFSKSFFEDYNYSKVLYQDLYMQNYIKNFFKYNLPKSIVHNISIQRKGFKIYVFIDYYRGPNPHGNKTFGNTKFKKKSARIKRKLRWTNKKRLYIMIKRHKRSLRNPLQRYVNRRLKQLPNKYEKVLFTLIQKNKVSDFSVFSLKRLLILNLIFLTGCVVQVRVRNIAKLFRLPYFLWKVRHPVLRRYYKKYIITIKNVMYKLRIRNNRRLYGFSVVLFIHLFFTSLVFKNPNLVGVFLSGVLKKNIRLFHIFFNFLSRIVSAMFAVSSLNGLKIQFKGRLGTSLRKKRASIVLGTMPLQTLDSLIKYSFTESMTVYGVCSIKIWYYY